MVVSSGSGSDIFEGKSKCIICMHCMQNVCLLNHVKNGTWVHMSQNAMTYCHISYNVGRTIMMSHSFGNGLYQLSMVSWGLVYCCYTHIIPYTSIHIYIYIIGMSRNEVPFFGSKMATLRGNKGTSF